MMTGQCRRTALAACLLAAASPAFARDDRILARVEVTGPLTAFAAPVHAHLRGTNGDYLLTVTRREDLDRSGWPYQVLDSGAGPEAYVLARARLPGARRAVRAETVIHDDGRNLVLKIDPAEAEALSEKGLDATRLRSTPLLWSPPDAALRLTGPALMKALAPNSFVTQMIARVQSNDVLNYVQQIAGSNLTVVGGDLYRIQTRHTSRTAPMQKATQRVYEHFQALGLQAGYQAWSASGSSGRNVTGELPGGSASNEIVVVVAHLDDMPNAAVAPGADDNASGVVGVLIAAEILARYRFERTIRFLAVTGEEQGLLGSDAYAQEAYNNGDNIVAVYNMDMIAWNTAGSSPRLNLYTRTSSNPGYAADLAIAQMFTNVVATYGLSGGLTPVLIQDGGDYSDHASFWAYGFAAILAIEDDLDDFNPYYHTASDTIPRLNVPYFTSFVKASVGTVAHLARPVRRVPFDLIQVDNGDWVSGSGIGIGTVYLRHEEGAAESGADPRDIAWSAAPTNPYAKWLKIHTAPYGTALQTDARPTNSQTIFYGTLSAVNTNAGAFSCTNRLRFTFVGSPESNRVYSVRVHVHDTYAVPSNEFTHITNLSSLVARGGILDLPRLTNLANGAVYGTCDIGTWLVSTDPADFPVGSLSIGGQQVTGSIPAQAGVTAVDTWEVSTQMTDGATWQAAGSFTNSIPPGAANFDSGWASAS